MAPACASCVGVGAGPGTGCVGAVGWAPPGVGWLVGGRPSSSVSMLTEESCPISIARRSSSANSFGVWKRFSMLRSSAFWNHVTNDSGRSGRSAIGSGSGAFAIWANVIATP